MISKEVGEANIPRSGPDMGKKRYTYGGWMNPAFLPQTAICDNQVFPCSNRSGMSSSERRVTGWTVKALTADTVDEPTASRHWLSL
jgi:hypothetical protein